MIVSTHQLLKMDGQRAISRLIKAIEKLWVNQFLKHFATFLFFNKSLNPYSLGFVFWTFKNRDKTPWTMFGSESVAWLGVVLNNSSPRVITISGVIYSWRNWLKYVDIKHPASSLKGIIAKTRKPQFLEVFSAPAAVPTYRDWARDPLINPAHAGL